jgi:hypothetical protein
VQAGTGRLTYPFGGAIPGAPGRRDYAMALCQVDQCISVGLANPHRDPFSLGLLSDCRSFSYVDLFNGLVLGLTAWLLRRPADGKSSPHRAILSWGPTIIGTETYAKPRRRADRQVVTVIGVTQRPQFMGAERGHSSTLTGSG